MITEGIILMVVGMGTVFIFLLIMIGIMNLFSFLMKPLGKLIPEPEAINHNTVKVASTENYEEIAIAVAATRSFDK